MSHVPGPRTLGGSVDPGQGRGPEPGLEGHGEAGGASGGCAV